ncbi:Uncharacterised protein [Vibrio cholerae]|nr:Uncharacterised protein [Vibrio cholerae]
MPADIPPDVVYLLAVIQRLSSTTTKSGNRCFSSGISSQ